MNKNLWLGTVIAFIFGLLFGPGIIWQYKNMTIAEQKLTIDKAQLGNEFREKLLHINNELTNKSGEYIEIRDKFIEKKATGIADEARYNLQNKYNSTKMRLIQLINDYNILEAKLSQIEVRQPKFFNVSNVIPPTKPTNFRVEYDENGEGSIKWDFEPDEVHEETFRYIKNLFELYGQDLNIKENK